ncbi:hypothetical protein [Candidatus Pelagibacter ubique]|uniref:hypothetical protein n=1 Tax=Pelagibacter ubique TaxID=198252 RepID=UPI0003C7F0FF
MKKKKLYYPFYDEKISKHLIKNNFNNDCNGFWFIGGDLLKRKYVFKHSEIDDSFKILYPQLLKKSRLSKKLKFFFWAIRYYVPNISQIKKYKKEKTYKHDWKITSHLLELINSDYNNSKKLYVSSDLFISNKKENKAPHGKEMEAIILVTNLLKDLREIKFRMGFLQKSIEYGWLKPNNKQDEYIQNKLKKYGWFSPKIDIKNYLLDKSSIYKTTDKEIDYFSKFSKKSITEVEKIHEILRKNYAREVKGKIYGTNLKDLVYLRKKINPKIKFTFYKLDKVEKKILKKYKII